MHRPLPPPEIMRRQVQSEGGGARLRTQLRPDVSSIDVRETERIFEEFGVNGGFAKSLG